jgi:hypothetical protein
VYSSTNGLTKNINELQSDILAEKLSNNPYLKYHVLIEKNKQLNTTSQTVIGAINEVLRKTNSTSTTNKAALAELYNVLGHVGVKPELTHKVLAQAPSLIDLVLDLNAKLSAIEPNRNVSFKDQFVTGDQAQFVFKLSHMPKDDTLKMFINGIQYFNTNTNAYTFDSTTKEVVWVFDSENGGFDPANSEIIFEYTYDLKQELEDLQAEEGGN